MKRKRIFNEVIIKRDIFKPFKNSFINGKLLTTMLTKIMLFRNDLFVFTEDVFIINLRFDEVYKFYGQNDIKELIYFFIRQLLIIFIPVLIVWFIIVLLE